MRPPIMPNVFGSRHVKKTADGTASTPISLFTVTGDVLILIFGVVKATWTTSGAITAEVGVSGDIAKLIAQVADATALAINEVWIDATPDSTIEDVSGLAYSAISNSQSVILTTTGTVTAGSVEFHCFWHPLSSNGLVTAAA